MNFAERLKTARMECGLTQRNVYTQLKVSANCYASYEQGRTEPSIEMLKHICKVLNISADYLIGLEDKNGNKVVEHNTNTDNSGTHIGDVIF